MHNFVNKNFLMTLKSTAVSSTLSRVEPEIISSNLRLNYLKIKLYYDHGTMIHTRNLHFPFFLSVKTEPKSSAIDTKYSRAFIIANSYYLICSFYFPVKARYVI